MFSMGSTKITLSASARKFTQKNGITDVTFNLRRAKAKGSLNEIEPVYQTPPDASTDILWWKAIMSSWPGILKFWA